MELRLPELGEGIGRDGGERPGQGRATGHGR